MKRKLKDSFYPQPLKLRNTVVVFMLFFLSLTTFAKTVHVFEKVEITLKAQKQYSNPYTQVDVWVDLKGPGFNRRCYGFWDGNNVFRVRVCAVSPGQWSWVSRSNQADDGLNGKQGGFEAIEWSEAEKESNPVRRGMIKASENGHALTYDDGTPYILIGDTWWSTATYRFPWYDDDKPREIGPEAGFKDYVRLRKNQGFNCIGMIAAFPNWARDDGAPWHIWLDEEKNTGVRSAWVHQKDINTGVPRKEWRAKNMHNEGGRAFHFPGKVPGYKNVFPDVNRINPEYFKYMDRKIDYLNDQGFIPFIEVSRRDVSGAWKEYYQWPDTYSRYIQYIWARYQANICLYSPVHFDWIHMTATTEEFNDAANFVIDRWGAPPFGTLVSCNSAISSLVNFGEYENNWLTFHQIGNRREHDFYWYLTEIFHADPPRPAVNAEPYYAGLEDKRYEAYKFGAEGGTKTDDLYVRSALYGSFLSGGYGGYIYGAEGIWGADIEDGSDPPMWEAFLWNSANQLRFIKTFALSEGSRYQNLVPDADLVSPNKNHLTRGYTGWAYAARTPEKDYFLLYFEKDIAAGIVRGAQKNTAYTANWFNPKNGEWAPAGKGQLESDIFGRIELPEKPSEDDWGLKLVKVGQSTKPRVIVMHDIGGDPDDEQSLVRQLVYANEMDIEAITMVDLVRNFVDSTQQDWTRNRHDEILGAYGEAYPNLAQHAEGFPTEEYLQSISYMGTYGLRFAGKAGYPEPFWDWVGEGKTPLGDDKDSPASNAIVKALEKDDPRPLYVMMWGGAYTLVQALWRYEQKHPDDDYSDRLIVSSILWQDMAFDYFRDLSKIGYHYSRTFQGSYDGERNTKPLMIDNAFFDFWYKNSWTTLGEYEQDQFEKDWADEHIRSHGALGSMYPEAGHRGGTREGDSPTILYLLSAIKGLNEIKDPTMGSWGGRFVLADQLGPQYFVNSKFGVTNISEEMLKDEKDGFRDIAMTFARWRRDIQNDFQARMDWVITPEYENANHNPVAVLNGDESNKIHELSVNPGEEITLDAGKSHDPDQDELSYEWFRYPEADSYNGELIIKSTESVLKFAIPADLKRGENIHVILRVKDNGIPNLVSYKRVIFSY